MKSIRIVDTVPSFYDIYSLFCHSKETKYVFEESYYFRDNQIPSDSEREILNKNKLLMDDLIILTPELIDQFGERFAATANCIHVYDHLKTLQRDIILFKNLNWDWAYYCHDDIKVEIFIKTDHEEAYKTIKSAYNYIDIEFPGLISSPGGFHIL